jgi:AraC-like DNA-binding protein
LAKIAVELDRAVARRKARGTSGCTTPRVIAAGDGWSVADVLCTCGPHDRPFEEQHARHTLAVVLAGSFQYRSSLDGGVMTPGSLMLGNPGQSFECGHEHGEGDRCLSFSYTPEYFERLAADAGIRGTRVGFGVGRLPPSRVLSSVIARARLGVESVSPTSWEELGVALAVRTLKFATGKASGAGRVVPKAEARVTRTVRLIDRHPDAALTLSDMSRAAGLSPFHFLRTFERVTGVTPHQYVLRARLREAAFRIVAEARTVLDIALDCGFGDVSSFNRAFRAEFGVSPRQYRLGIRD